MPVPKKKKFDVNVYQGKEGAERVEELMQKSDDKTTFLPPSITLMDIDTETVNLVSNGVLAITARGNAVPCIFMSNERWAIFSKTWMISDVDKNISTPFITINRKDVKKGTYLGESSTIANKKKFQYHKVPTFENGVHGYDVYKIPQPSPVDVEYEIQMFCRDIKDLNIFLEQYISEFSDLQIYMFVNGHPFSVVLNSNTTNDNINDIQGDRYSVGMASITVKGYLQQQAKFTKEKTINRVMNTLEMGEDKIDFTSTIDTEGNKE
jgi:hypothetical protein